MTGRVSRVSGLLLGQGAALDTTHSDVLCAAARDWGQEGAVTTEGALGAEGGCWWQGCGVCDHARSLLVTSRW